MHRVAARVCIVGGGPAGFYTAQNLLKLHPTVHVDIVEKLPVPYGLVRFGVAPDHPEVKNVINTFSKVANQNRCRFLGNINIGRDISLGTLQSFYNAVVFAYGAENDRELGIDGENHRDVISARQFVGWYNGYPGDVDFNPNLQGNTAVILGHGNVALDVARILLKSPDSLSKTDITDYSLRQLRNSCIKKVYLMGRRGPLQVSFTVKELREMTKLPGCSPVFDPADFEPIRASFTEIPRSRKRLTELMCKTAFDPPKQESGEREWILKFLSSPKKVVTDGKGALHGIEFELNQLDGHGRAIGTGKSVFVQCDLVVRSIGYKSVCIDPDIPFDDARGAILNEGGRVQKGLYCSGWVKTGPVGVIASTMNDAMDTAKALLDDMEQGEWPQRKRDEDLADVLKGIHHQVVLFENWEQIDKRELEMGCTLGKSREKVVNIAEMMELAFTGYLSK